MSGSILWKVLLSVAITAWAVLNLFPIRDIPLETYVVSHARADVDELEALVQKAVDRVEASEGATSVFAELRTLIREENVDLAKFFPNINLADIRNQERRNEVLFNELVRRSQSNLRLGLDLLGGLSVTLRIDERALEGKDSWEREEMINQAIEIMGRRIDGFGVSEPIIRPRGNDSIEVQLPGLSTRNNPEAINELRKPARLEFRIVHPLNEELIARGETNVRGYELLIEERENSRTGDVQRLPTLVRRIPAATGDILARARPQINQMGGFSVGMDFTREGGRRFGDITARMVEEAQEAGPNVVARLAVVLDGQLFTAPTVRQALRDGRAEITGQFSQREAIDLSNVLNNPLAFDLQLDELSEVGPTLAAEARESSVNAAILGGVLVVIAMLLYYGIGGIVAVLSVGLNLIIVIGVLASLGATLTLPGIAALILTLGMAVDANILIFERLREELKSGKSIKNALQGAYEKAFSTIVDANVTTLIAALILIWLGTGPVRGFGVTLAIGIGTTVFGALILSRIFLEVIVHKLGIGKVLFLDLIKSSEIRFLRYRRPAFIASWSVILIGLVAVFMRGDNIFGIDFRGGDEVTVTYSERLNPIDVQEAITAAGLSRVNVVFQTLLADNVEVMRIQAETEEGTAAVAAVQAAFPNAGLEIIGETQIGAAVSRQIQWNAVFSVALAMIGVLLYVAVRFEVGYGIGAIVAIVHDILMTIGIFVLLGGQFSAPMIAAVLMILGYSINNSIVVFDRIREELQLNPTVTLGAIINLSINRVLARTILTSATTLMASLALLIFGAGIINDFALVFILGILTGTFSSIFIASPVFYWWHKGDRRHVEEREFLPKYDWQSTTKAAE
jgi:SecD/SecF fusion protein